MAASGTITGATAIVMMSIPLLFPVPQQLQGFAADDVFDTDPIDSAEVLMGVDGRLSGGFVFVPIKQGYSLQADSASVDFFDQWWTAQQLVKDVYTANAVVVLNTIGKKWVMTKGFLTGYPPISNVKKLLQPRKFGITWESISPAVV